MNYFDWKSPSVLWFNHWRSYVAKAKWAEYPEQKSTYERASCMAQAEHVMAMALETISK